MGLMRKDGVTSVGRRPADPGALLYRTRRLTEGRLVRLRLARPTDAEPIRAYVATLATTTDDLRATTRFLESDERRLRRLTHYDPRRRTVVCAVSPAPGGEVVVGLGDVTYRGEAAEARVSVAAADRRQGIGRLMIDALAHLAVHRGARQLVAERAPGIHALLAGLGKPRDVREDGRALVSVDLPPLAQVA